MNDKKILLSVALFLLSLVLATSLGLLDFFGFLTGAHALNFVYLALALVTWHLLGLVIFLLTLDRTRTESLYLATAVGFGAVFFGLNQHYLTAIAATLAYFGFQLYAERSLARRSDIFMHYSTREVVLPVIRGSFLFLLVIFVTIGFFEAKLRTEKTNLITPNMIVRVSRPLIPILNKQLERQLPANLPFKLQINWEQDLEVVAKDVAGQVNAQLATYVPFLPFMFAALVWMIASPAISLSQWLLLPAIRLVIALLIREKFILVTTESATREVLKL